jgi:hypothetical protein
MAKIISRARPRLRAVAQPKPAPVAPPPRWGFIAREELEALLSANLIARWQRRAPLKVYLGDEQYYCPAKNEALDIIRRSRRQFRDWSSEIFDCDDFAFVLKAHFCRSAFRNGKRRWAYCFGIVWKNKPEPHAMNWVVYRDYDPATRGGGKLVFALVEPQWFVNPALQRIRPLAPSDGDIYFITA